MRRTGYKGHCSVLERSFYTACLLVQYLDLRTEQKEDPKLTEMENTECNDDSRQDLLNSGRHGKEMRNYSQEKSDERDQNMCVNIWDFIKKAFHIEALKNEPFFTLLFLPCQIMLDVVFIGWILFMVSYAISVGL